jgi:hypothetical protein
MDDAFTVAMETNKEVLVEKRSNFVSNVCQILLNFHHCYNESMILSNDHKPLFEETQKKIKSESKKEEPKKEIKKEEPKKLSEPKVVDSKSPRGNIQVTTSIVDSKSPRGNKPPPPKHAPKDAPKETPKADLLCVPVFQYKAQGKDELSLEVNQVIKIIKKDSDGWWLGECNGKQGVFPENYVKEVVPFTTKSMYDYQPQEKGELGLKVGQSITVYLKNPDGWWLGQVNNNFGIFPGNYTEAGQ